MLQVELHQIAAMVNHLAEIARKLECASRRKESRGRVANPVSSWMVIEDDGRTMIVRVKPATVITVKDSAIVFVRDHVRLEASTSMVKLCKWRYCKQVDLSKPQSALDYLQQLTYLVREVSWYVSKSIEGLNAALKKEAPECLRI